MANATPFFDWLDEYLQAARAVLARWQQWLAQHEQCILAGDMAAALHHAQSIGDLEAELDQLRQRRGQLLEQARGSGLPSTSLKQLAQSLPQWTSNARFRDRFREIERNLAHLRRLHTATWILVHQSLRLVDDTMLLMTCGSALCGAYIEVPQADTSGGQILDAQV
jgi:FlgN protein